MEKKSIKRVFSKAFIIGLALATFTGVNAKVQETTTPIENDDYIEPGTVVYGVTKFRPTTIVSGKRVGKAATDYVNTVWEEIDNVTMYAYAGGVWLEYDIDNNVKVVEDQEALATLDILFIDNVEKTIEIEYDAPEGASILTNTNEELTCVDGKISVPASARSVFVYDELNHNLVAKFLRTGSDEFTKIVVEGSLSLTTTNENLAVDGNTVSGTVAWGEEVSLEASISATLNGVEDSDLIIDWVLLAADGTSKVLSSNEDGTYTIPVENLDGEYVVTVVWSNGFTTEFTVTLDVTRVERRLGTLALTEEVEGFVVDEENTTSEKIVLNGTLGWNETVEVSVTATNEGFEPVTKTLTLSEDEKTASFDVEWEEGNTQTFIVELGDVTVEPKPEGTIADADIDATTGDTSYSTVESTKGLTYGGVIAYKSIDGVISGHVVGVKLTPNAVYTDESSLVDATVTIEDANGSTTYAYITQDEETDPDSPVDLTRTFEVAFSDETREATVTVVWEDGNEQVFTVKMDSDATLAHIPAATLTIKDSENLQLTEDNMIAAATEGYVIPFTPSNDSVLPQVTAGYYATVTLTSLDVEDMGLNTTATWTVDGNTQIPYWLDGTEDVVLIFDDATTTHTIEITWADDNVQTFVIGIEDSVLEARPKATLAVVDNENLTVNENGNITSATEETYVIPFTERQYGPTGEKAYYVDVEFVLPEEYTELSYSDFTWSIDDVAQMPIIEDGTLSAIFRVSSVDETHTVVFNWPDGNTQTMVIGFENVALEEAPTLELSFDDLEATATDKDYEITSVVPAFISGLYTAPLSSELPTDGAFEVTSITVSDALNEERTLDLTDFQSRGTTLFFKNEESLKTAVITVVWDNGESQTYNVTATDFEVLPTEIAVEDMNLIAGDEAEIVATFPNEDPTDNGITYAVKDGDATDVIEITDNKVKALTTGSVTVVATSDRDSQIETEFTINVYSPVTFDVETRLDETNLQANTIKYLLNVTDVQGGAGTSSSDYTMEYTLTEIVEEGTPADVRTKKFSDSTYITFDEGKSYELTVKVTDNTTGASAVSTAVTLG